MFTSQPQDVEIYRANAWWPGSLLGWRHDADGDCQAWVRVSAGAGEETTWLALDYLRLPERGGRGLAVVGDAPAVPVGVADDSAFTGTMAAIRAVPRPSGRRTSGAAAPSELTATMNLVAVRDVAGDPVHAVATDTTRRAGGRRRAPEPATGELPAVDAVPASAASGRHRAPAASGGIAGRHRAADTGVRPAVRDDADQAATLSEAAPRAGAVRDRGRGRTDLPARPRLTAATPVADSTDSHPLTRPMRLGDLVGPLDGAAPRRGALNGRLSGV